MRLALTVFGWAVLFVTGLFALYMLFIGLTFGFALWNPDNLKPTILWLGVLVAPVIVAIGLRKRETPAALIFALIAACLLDTAWIVPVLNR